MPEPTPIQTGGGPPPAPTPGADTGPSPNEVALAGGSATISPSGPSGEPVDFILGFEAMSQGHTSQQPEQGGMPQQGQFKPRTYRNEQEKRIFSAMSNEAYNQLYPLYLEHTDGKLIPKQQIEELERKHAEATKSRWYDHPNGYTLTEDYNKLNNDVILSQEVLTHYGQQLQALAAGQPIQMVMQDKDGNWQIGAQQFAASPMAQAAITGEIAKFNAMLQSSQDKLANYKQGFTGRFDAIKNGLERVRQEVFGKFQDNPQFKEAVSRELAGFPAEVRGSPEYSLIAMCSVLLKAFSHQAQQNRARAVPGQTHMNNAAGGAIGDPRLSAGNQLEDMLTKR